MNTAAASSGLIFPTLSDGESFTGLSGISANHTSIALGRAASEARLGIAAGAGSYAVGSVAGDAILRVDDSSKKLHLLAGSGGAVMTVTSSNVGIGTTSPASKLHVLDGDIRVSTSAGQPSKGIVFQDGSVQTTAAGGVGGGWTDTGSVVQLVTPTDTLGSTGAGVTVSTHLIVSAGNVGIGLSAPAGKLHVGDSTAAGVILDNRLTALTSKVGAQIAWAESGSYSAGDMLIAPRTDIAGAVRIFTGTGVTERLTVSGAGNVGIGTNAPAQKLDVSGGRTYLRANAEAYALQLSRAANAEGYFLGTSPEVSMPHLVFSNNLGVERVRFQDNGNVGIGTTAPGAKLDVLGNGIFHLTAADDKINLSPSVAGSGGQIYVTNAAADAYRPLELQGSKITLTQGNVGIGTINPASKLHMSSGTIIIDGNAATALTTVGNAGIGTGGTVPADRLEVAGGNVRLTAVAGSAGSVKLFSTLTVGAVTCTAQCGANTFCLAAWDSAGVASTCGTAAASTRCLCSGFGN